MQFSQSELSTIRLAALAWAERCKREAALMDEFSRDDTLSAERRAKAQRNAKASREFEAEARALAERILSERRTTPR